MVGAKVVVVVVVVAVVVVTVDVVFAVVVVRHFCAKSTKQPHNENSM